ncbi:MAG: transketolase C-terminal domain-containing protein, partial [Ginsengibacter sp.]
SAIRDVKAEGLDPAHYDIRFVKPLDEELLHEVFSKYSKIITVEDGTVVGGFGSAILEFMNEHGYKANVKILGIPDEFIEHGSPKQLYDEIGIDATHIAEAIREMSKIDVSRLLAQ